MSLRSIAIGTPYCYLSDGHLHRLLYTLAAERAARLLPIPCGSGEPGDPVSISASGGPPQVQDTVPAKSTASHLEEAGSDLHPLVTHSSCCACLSGRSLRRQIPQGVPSEVRTVCSSSCKYGSVRGVAGNGHPYRDGVSLDKHQSSAQDC